MAGPLDWLFGGSTPQPARPTSRGATFGAKYQGMPTSSRIDDQRQAAPDYPSLMRNPPDPRYDGEDWWNTATTTAKYEPSSLGGGSPTAHYSGSDPMLDAGPMLSRGAATAEDVAPYFPSFQSKMRARRAALPGFGPNLPIPLPSNLGSISPGGFGWTSPPSLSGPHNPQGDPPRPGYAGNVITPTDFYRGTTLNYAPPGSL